jgi:hypothetical protein
LGGSDFVKIGNQYLRINIVEDLHHVISINDTNCWNCKGILGLSHSSVFWKIWPEISFSRSRITLGEIGNEIGLGAENSLNIINCIDYESFCKTYGSIRYENSLIEDVSIIFDPTSQNIELPDYIFDEYTSNKNVYKDNIEDEWGGIFITIDFRKDLIDNSIFKKVINHWEKDLKLDQKKIGTTLNFNIKPSQLTRENQIRRENFFLKRNGIEKNYIKLGTLSLKSQIFHKYGEYMLVQNFPTNDSISTENLILFAIQLVLSIRWKITHFEILVPIHEHLNNSLIEIFYELLGIVITITAFVLPSTLDLMSSHINYYISTAILIGLALSIKVIIWVREIYDYKKKRHLFMKFEYYTFRSFSQEVILTTGIWILVLESRLENLDSILILIANVFLLYTISYYTYIILHYIYLYLFEYKIYIKVISGGNVLNYDSSTPSKIWQFRFFTLVVFFVFGYQSIVTVNFFLRPLFVENFEEFKEILIPGLVFLYIFVLIFSSLMVGLLLEKEKVIISSKDVLDKKKLKKGE